MSRRSARHRPAPGAGSPRAPPARAPRSARRSDARSRTAAVRARSASRPAARARPRMRRSVAVDHVGRGVRARRALAGTGDRSRAIASCPGRTSPDSTTPSCTIARSPAFWASMHADGAGVGADHAVVPHLTAALRVERRAIQEHAHRLALLGDLELPVLVAQEQRDRAFRLGLLVARRTSSAARRRRPARSPPSSTAARARSFCSCNSVAEPILVDLHARVGRELDRQLDREAERVGQLERVVARDHAVARPGPAHRRTAPSPDAGSPRSDPPPRRAPPR